jgi:hypothetical protein
MMMMMLEAGGMELITDNIRGADEDNPKGYYEFEKVKQIEDDASWLDSAEGKVFKMVSMLLYNLPLNKKYKIIFMKRNMEEMLVSQKKMLGRKGKNANGTDNGEMAKIYAKHLKEIEEWLRKQNNIDVLYVNYNEVIQSPEENVQEINQFLDNKLDIGKMVGVVDESLYRQRK